MIQVSRHNQMTIIDGEFLKGERNFSCCYIDGMYKSGDGFGIQHNHFEDDVISKHIKNITDRIHDLVKELNEINKGE